MLLPLFAQIVWRGYKKAPLLINLTFDFFSRGGVQGKEISVVKPVVTIISFMEFYLEQTKRQWFHVFCTRVVWLNTACFELASSRVHSLCGWWSEWLVPHTYQSLVLSCWTCKSYRWFQGNLLFICLLCGCCILLPICRPRYLLH